MRYAEIILPLALEGTLTYGVPNSCPLVGARVLVPLGKSRTYVGIVAEVHDRKPDFELRNIIQILDEEPVLLPTQLKLWHWISDYYLCPIGDVYSAAIPSGLKKVKKRTRNKEQGPKDNGVFDSTLYTLHSTLSNPQFECLQAIEACEKRTVLLHGVTSSGKTEIYIHLIAKAIERGEQALYLLPEIALTVQIMQRLRRVFGDRLGIYHSRCTEAERVEFWRKQLSDNPYDVVLGARSAVFLPMKRLGLVILDEEHENSFKQQDPAPRYHARSVAAVLAQMTNAKLILGTATPSLESLYNAMNGKYGIVSLTTRFSDIELPKVELVDIKDLRRRKMMSGSFSPQLCEAVREALANDKQVILFHNRRGYSREIECRDCGWIPKCKNCDVSLVYHRTYNLLTCHYCGYTYPVPTECPACAPQPTRLMQIGLGTERVEDEFIRLFPEARVARMDLDTTRKKDSYDEILSDFASGKTNVLIGTQMVSKGLDFDRVAVVGILDADSLLNRPDFRAHETAYQMLTQVSGRAGRKGERGRVILQTRNIDEPIIQQVAGGRWQVAELLAERQAFNFPPFTHIIVVQLRHVMEAVVDSAAQELAGRLRQWFGTRVLGPDKPSVARIRNQSLRQIMLKIESSMSLSNVRPYLRAAQNALLEDKRYTTLSIYYDVDPQ